MLSADPGSTTWRQRTTSTFTEATLTHCLPAPKVISPIYANFSGTIGDFSGNKRLSSHSIVDFLVVSLDRPRGQGNKMVQCILKANRNVIPWRTSQPLKVKEIHSQIKIKKLEIFDKLIKRRWGTSIKPPKKSDENNDLIDQHLDNWDYYEDDE